MANGDKLTELEGNLPLVAVALEQRRLGFALEDAIAKLQGFDFLLKRFDALTRSAEILSSQISSAKVDIREAIDAAAEFGSLMASAQDKGHLDLISRDFTSLEREIGRFTRAVSAMLDRYVTLNFVPLSALGQLLRRMGQENLGSRLQRLEADWRNASRGSAVDWPERLQKLQSVSTSLQSELKLLARDPDVNAFLLALGKGQASLSLVTPQVLKWLGEHNALDQFRVTSS